ncbi:Uncharacterised protein [Mycobacteroides abscessus subsp. abscessus]|nr:Uncharacterised protein [Mycobacteroides abscessus subsp. abscessus]
MVTLTPAGACSAAASASCRLTDALRRLPTIASTFFSATFSAMGNTLSSERRVCRTYILLLCHVLQYGPWSV